MKKILSFIKILLAFVLFSFAVYLNTVQSDGSFKNKIEKLFKSCISQRKSMPRFIDGWIDSFGGIPVNINKLSIVYTEFFNDFRDSSGKYLIGNLFTSYIRPACPLFGKYKIRNHLNGYECICSIHNPVKYYSKYSLPENMTLLEAVSEWELSPQSHFTGHERALELINSGCDLNQQDASGRTALIIAAKYWFSDIVDLLISKKADLNVIDKSGYSAVQYVLRSYCNRFLYFDNNKIMRLYAKNESYSKGKFYTSWPEIYIKFLPKLIDATTTSEAYEIHNRIPEEISLLLIRNGADVNVKGPENRTLLMEATFLNMKHLVPVLIEKGIDLNAHDNNGLTALKIARILGFSEIEKTLTEAGAME